MITGVGRKGGSGKLGHCEIGQTARREERRQETQRQGDHKMERMVAGNVSSAPSIPGFPASEAIVIINEAPPSAFSCNFILSL